ncbi:copper-translocating P-type ATPase [Bordetella genomosp. 9]|uniref:P-type Zn(2+) transporter n=1 Tax=Bordetella genomosp. 9 TaxID=1416803 RepID=A0A261R171_9BORD|nr:heavy metal translocating P-type ATPase [Bordetella genomosp. 9]OZI18370.1 copper-translocating P-type ATPase [Bordetella genomosp. 9]
MDKKIIAIQPSAHRHGDGCCHDHAHEHSEGHAHGHAHGHDHSHGHGHGHGNGHDHDHGHDHEHAHAHGADCCQGAPAQAAGAASALDVPAGMTLTRMRIGQMDCPTEEALLRKKLGTLPGVGDLHFDLMRRVLSVVHDEGGQEQVLAGVRAVGMTPEVLAGQAPVSAPPAEKPRWKLLALAGVLAALAEIAHFAGLPAMASAALAIASVLACGLNTYRKGWIAVRNGNLNINALMSIAVTGAAVIGQWPEAAMVMFLFNVAEQIEARSLDRARNAVRGLLDLTPPNATRRQADGTWSEVPAAELIAGDVVRVRPGERIAADGVVVNGRSSVDQSAITGESMPADKTAGDQVYAATVNAEGSFEYRVTAAAQDTTLARIIHAVEQAAASRAPMQRFIDRFSRIYTPTVVIIAILAACVPPLLWAQPWAEAVYRALALLIIACPCALVISTPVSIVSGLTAASRRGILVKGGVYLENGRKLRWVAFDKTGTLTHGKPVLTELRGIDGKDVDAGLAASLAARSDHPVSRAIAAGHGGGALRQVEDFTALPGRGVRGSIDGTLYHLGNRRLMREQGWDTPAVTAALDALEAQGKTAVVLCDAGGAIAVAAVADTVRGESRAAIDQLHAQGVRTLMLSGDNAAAVRAIAGELGISDARGDQLPEDKLAALESHMRDGLVGMVGDGINDAPALARADIGFAMGAAGTGTAIETADVALMDDDPRKIAEFVALSRATHRVLVQNIVLALGIKAVFLVLALSGLATLWMAVFADVGTSLLVVANGLRLLKPRIDGQGATRRGHAGGMPPAAMATRGR